MEAARHQANELTRPQGHRGPTPSDLWSVRVPIGPEQRKQFLAAVERHRAEILAERKGNLNLKNKNHQRQVQRQAVRRALLECGLLTITWRSVSPPLNPKKRDKIS
jgi:nucleoid-associated protein YgaU